MRLFHKPTRRLHAESENPAYTSERLQFLFTGIVGAAEQIVPGMPDQLGPSESAGLLKAVPARAQEFAAGRQCVRRAAESLGMGRFALPAGRDGCPAWPPSVTGSITHTTGFCGAVVAERRHFHALGVDAELIGAVTSDLWPQILSPEEQYWLSRLPSSGRARAATLLLSAKEAFYKCQYMLTQQWLEFSAVTVRLAGDGEPEGHFFVCPQGAMRLLARLDPPIAGRFRIAGPLVLTGLAIPA